ncbi:reverse transcriptase family protein, partial [Enterobacter cloacae complex sp. 2DZ2F20B]|uniref:RNA-directed DNA polymerase n=1 Tax=Enterobacter cloacae complex sp. 2DZ2F20B TaxID=2511993 RepID=UPI0013ED7A24
MVPIYKKGDPDDIGNYRPISLLPIFSKIFEKLMLQQITKYLNKYNLLTLQQFGFRKGLSTSTAISALVDKIIQSFERKEYYSTHFLDLSTAFDCVTHDILLRKLYYY